MPRPAHATPRPWLLALVTVPLLAACGGSTDASAFTDPGPQPQEDAATTSDGTPTPTPDGSAVDSAVPTEDSDVPVEDSAVPVEDTATPDDTGAPPDDTGTPPDDTGVVDGGPGDTGTVACTEPSSAIFGGHCYFPLAPRTWQAARDFCVSRGAHLVTITSSAEQTFVQGMLSGNDRWIGLYRPSTGGSPAFRWVTTEAVSYTRWAPGEPNGSGSCARLLDDGRWADFSCSQTFNAICERE